jgi:hypothetical protein
MIKGIAVYYYGEKEEKLLNFLILMLNLIVLHLLLKMLIEKNMKDIIIF